MTNASSEATAIGGHRPTEVKGLKELKLNSEGGTKKEYEDFLKSIERHVGIAWQYGSDIAQAVKLGGQKPNIPEPKDLDKKDKNIKWKVRVWEKRVDNYTERLDIFEENAKALYSLILTNVSTATRAKIVSTKGFGKADNEKNPMWLLGTIEDIKLQIVKRQLPLLTISEQNDQIATLRQKPNETNEDFMKSVAREIKVFEKQGKDFLWGESQERSLEKAEIEAKTTYMTNNGQDMPDNEIKEV